MDDEFMLWHKRQMLIEPNIKKGGRPYKDIDWSKQAARMEGIHLAKKSIDLWRAAIYQ
jgi:hypothetical protein